MKPFTYLVPCKLNITSSFMVDTTQIPDGEHEMQVVVYDATEEGRAASAPQTIMVDNVPDPAPAPDPGSGSTPPSGSDSTTTSPSSSSSNTSSETTTTSSNTTGSSAASAKRTGRSWRAQIVLKIAPKRVRNMHTIHLRGRLIGGPLARRGVTLLAQARRKKTGWIVFRQLGVSGRGKFAFDYRFHSTTRPTTYTFRIALANANRRSTHRTVSNSVKVRVRP